MWQWRLRKLQELKRLPWILQYTNVYNCCWCSTRSQFEKEEALKCCNCQFWCKCSMAVLELRQHYQEVHRVLTEVSELRHSLSREIARDRRLFVANVLKASSENDCTVRDNRRQSVQSEPGHANEAAQVLLKLSSHAKTLHWRCSVPMEEVACG